MEGVPILSLMLLVPMLGAAACLFSGEKAARTIALAATTLNLALGILLWVNYDIGGAQWQFVERAPIFAGFSPTNRQATAPIIGTSSMSERSGSPPITPAPT